MTTNWRSARGISLIETTIMLLVVSILTGVIAPTAKRTIDQARLTRVVSDQAAIKTAIVNFRTDTAFRGFRINGSVAEAAAANANAGTVVETLVSDGDIPTCITVPLLGCQTTTDWKNVVNNATGLTDFLERHLITNNPRASAANNYLTTVWRGAYLNGPVDPDPWGNRYAVNVKWLNVNSQCVGGGVRRLANDVFVLSAGPDETIDTPYQFDAVATCTAGTVQTSGAYPTGDDMITVITRDAGALTVP